MKISVSVNPNGAMRSLMYVLDDFAGFGFFPYFLRVFSKMDLKNEKFDYHQIIYTCTGFCILLTVKYKNLYMSTLRVQSCPA